MKLTVEQTEDLPFPVGCPVWYNFVPEESTKGDPPLMKQGVVESVSFDHLSRDMVYEIVYQDCEKGNITDEVPESKLAYAAQCPVTIIDSDGEGKSGTVLVSEPDSSGKIHYTVMIASEGSRARFEGGVDAKRVKYRRVKADTKEAAAVSPSAAVAKIPADQPSAAANDDRLEAKVSASVLEMPEEEVPSSITCESVAKNQSGSSNDGGFPPDKKRNHAAGALSPLSATPMKKPRVDSAYPRNDDHSHRTEQASHRSTGSYSHGNDSKGRGVQESRYFEMKIPTWLQRDQGSQRDLFFHLIGSKHQDKRQNRTVSHIERETNCFIKVNFDRRPHRPQTGSSPAPPITITVDTHSRRPILREVDEARDKIYELLLDYMNYIRDDGAKGRLIYDLASSEQCGKGSSDGGVVRARDPFGFGTHMSLVELPFQSYGGGRRRSYHAQCILQSHILGQLKSAGCLVKICGDQYGVPLRNCEPYALVMGNSDEGTDRAAGLVRETLDRHMGECSCGFL